MDECAVLSAVSGSVSLRAFQPIERYTICRHGMLVMLHLLVEISSFGRRLRSTPFIDEKAHVARTRSQVVSTMLQYDSVVLADAA